MAFIYEQDNPLIKCTSLKDLHLMRVLDFYGISKRNGEDHKLFGDSIINPHSENEKGSLRVIFDTIEQFAENEFEAANVKAAIGDLLVTAPLQRLGRLSQLGLIKPADVIRRQTFTNGVESSWFDSRLVTESVPQDEENNYLGGKRYEHVLKVAEVVALKCFCMRDNYTGEKLSKEYVFHYIFAAILHDIGHPVMSHKGEMAIKMALSLALHSRRNLGSQALLDYTNLDHEDRVGVILDTDRVKQIIERVGLNKELLMQFIREEKGCLNDADPAAYLSSDFKNYTGDDIRKMEFTDTEIVRLARTSKWNGITESEEITDEGIQIRTQLLTKRLYAYKHIYRHPEMARMEFQISHGLAIMINDGKISIEDLLLGDDETVLSKAWKIAHEEQSGRYKALKDALSGVLFPHTIGFDSRQLNRKLQAALKDPIQFQKAILALLQEEEATDVYIDIASWYVVTPYPYSQKRLKYGDKIVSLGVEPEPEEMRVALCFDESVNDDTIAKIQRIMIQGGTESEAKYIAGTSNVLLLSPIEAELKIGNLNITRSSFEQEDLYIFGRNIGLPEESYIRLRKVTELTDNKTRYKITYKTGNFGTTSVNFLERTEIEIELEESEYQTLVQNHDAVLNGSISKLSVVVSRIVADNSDIKLQDAGNIYNLRSRLILYDHEGHRCELDLDRIYFNRRPGIYRNFFENPDEIEIEIEQMDLPISEFLELLSYFDKLAVDHPHLLRKTKDSKLARLRRRN